MCNAAQNNYPCQWEEFDMLICNVRRLEVAMHELKKEIPILKLSNSPVLCEYFETKDGDA